MQTTRILSVISLACCLMFSACFFDSDHAAYVPTASVTGYISQEDADALTGDSAIPEVMIPFATSDMILTETDTGVAVNVSNSFGMAETIDAYENFSTLTFLYDDNGRISSYLSETEDDIFDDADVAYRFADNVMVRKAIFNEEDGVRFIRHIITAAAEDDDAYDVSLITVYRFTQAQGITDPDHDVSDGAVDSLCREYRDDHGRLIRQVFYDYDIVSPEDADNAAIRVVNLYQYDDSGRLTTSSRFYFADGFAGGDFAHLDKNHVSFESETRYLYDVRGNLRYLVRSCEEDEWCQFMAITWELQGMSCEAAYFLHDKVRWIDMPPYSAYDDDGLTHLLYPRLII